MSAAVDRPNLSNKVVACAMAAIVLPRVGLEQNLVSNPHHCEYCTCEQLED